MVLTFLAGLCAGWVTNVIAERFPVVEKPLFGPLRCVRSGEKLGFFDYIPVLGYALQKGKCRHCGKSLPWRFPLVELLLALAFTLAWPNYETNPFYVYLINAFYMWLLAVIALIDWRYRLIYPVGSLPVVLPPVGFLDGGVHSFGDTVAQQTAGDRADRTSDGHTERTSEGPNRGAGRGPASSANSCTHGMRSRLAGNRGSGFVEGAGFVS